MVTLYVVCSFFSSTSFVFIPIKVNNNACCSATTGT